MALSILAFTTSTNSFCLVFPLSSSSYDYNYGKIDWATCWSQGYSIGWMEGASGTAVSPRYVITATHVGDSIPTFGDGSANLHYTDYRLDLGGGISIVHLDSVVARYSPLVPSSSYVSAGDTVNFMGQGEVIVDFPRTVGGTNQAWHFYSSNWGSGANKALRSGSATVGTVTSDSYLWDFSQSPWNAAVSYGDSGTGVFKSGYLAAVMSQGTSTEFLYPDTCGNTSNQYYVFNPAGLVYMCNPYPPAERSHVTVVRITTSMLSQISDVLTYGAPVKYGCVAGLASSWHNYNFSGTYVYQTDDYSTINLTGVSNAGPQELYQHVKRRYYNDPAAGDGIGFTASDLSSAKTYHIRFHFGTIPFGISDYSKVNFRTVVTDGNATYVYHNVKPYTVGTYKGYVVDYPTAFVPNGSKQITGGVWPESYDYVNNVSLANTYAILSGVEIVHN